ncbi:hypothetical protein cypCar_00003490 [Cyprinus carpio]|nr:hypothetical protein cypCar_00003490 [Cyprinus carpio]
MSSLSFLSQALRAVHLGIMFSLIKLRRVFTVHQVPKAFHEDSIISGYRHPRSSATDCVLSLFQLTNETLNVWTHFLPTWYSETLGLPFLHYNHDIDERFSERQSPRLSKVLRILAFAFPYLFDNIPLFYRLFLCVGEGCTDNEANSIHVHHTLLAYLTAFLFATHLPERLAPGRFDYIGHSHQLFHVCAIIGTHFQMKAIEADMVLRRSQLLVTAPPITFNNTVGSALVCVCISLGIICLYSLPLLYGSSETHPTSAKGKKCKH